MKILWVCNVPNQDACEYKGIKGVHVGGWLTGLSNVLKKNKDINLVYCYPKVNGLEQDCFFCNEIKYYSFFAKSRFGQNKNCDSNETRKQIVEILKREQPDLIHIFGTEYYHAYLFYQLAEKKDSVCCSIQGLTSVCAEHFLNLIPYKYHNKINISSIVRGTLKSQKKALYKRGKVEAALLRSVKYVIGRTDWDCAATYFINRNRIYFKNNEILRDEFYTNEWNINNIQRRRIFFSQASSPIKGLNILVQAVALLKKEYPDIVVYVAGNDFISHDSIVKKLKYSTYAAYVEKLICKLDLNGAIKFTGMLDMNEMIEEYKRANVFVSSSVIENSSNSVGEAMLLGCPVVSSDVGGIKSLLQHEIEGLIYQADAPYMLAHSIKRIFDSDELAIQLSENAKKRAIITHNREINAKEIIDIYNSIINNKAI